MLFCGPSRSPELLLCPALTLTFGMNAARVERTLLFAVRTLLAAMMFDTFLSLASRIASAREIGCSVVSVGCCAPNASGAASSTINLRNMFSSAPSVFPRRGGL